MGSKLRSMLTRMGVACTRQHRALMSVWKSGVRTVMATGMRCGRHAASLSFIDV